MFDSYIYIHLYILCPYKCTYYVHINYVYIMNDSYIYIHLHGHNIYAYTYYIFIYIHI